MVLTEPLSPSAFAPFGDVLDTSGDPDRIINAGLCGRWHDRARLDFGPSGRAGSSLFRSETPTGIRAFLTAPGQGINLLRNTWHGVLTPLAPPGLFAVIDRIGDGPNLEEYALPAPLTVTTPTTA